MRNKIIMMVLSVALIVSLAVVGCAKPAPAPAPAPEKAQPVTIRLTTDTPDVMPQGVAATWFGEELERRIPGSEGKIYNASSLYNNPDSLEAMKAGNLEFCWATASKTAGILPQVLSLRLPALFSTYEQALAIPQTDLGKYLESAAAEKGFVCLGWGILSPYIGIATKERLLTIDDWPGKKVRCYEKALQTLEAELAGASPIVMPWGEFVPSVQSGVVNAGFTSMSSWGPVKETVPYFTCFGLIPDYYLFLAAEKWWNSLSPATREVIQEVVDQACAKQRDLQYESDMAALDELGTKDPSKPGIYVLSAEELEPYLDLWGEKVRDKAIQTIGAGGEEAIELVIATSKELSGK